MNAREIMRKLSDGGYVITEPRSHLAQAVAGETDSFDLGELEAHLHDAGVVVGRATLFRTVALFTRLGILHRVPLPDGTARYRQTTDTPTMQFSCTVCGLLFPLTATDVLFAVSAMSGQAALAVSHVIVYGQCTDCRARLKVTSHEHE